MVLFSKKRKGENKPHEKIAWVQGGIILKTLSSSKDHTALIVDPNESFHAPEFGCGQSKMLVSA